MLRLILLPFAYLILNSVYAMPMKLQADIQALSELKPADYIEKIDNFRLSIVNHLKFEREECQNKFRQPRRWTSNKEKQALNEQRRQCLNLVNDWKKDYFRALATAKKRYVSGVHANELKMIERTLQPDQPEGPVEGE